MTDTELTAQELLLSEIQDAVKDASALLERLQRIRSSRHLSIAVAGIENAIYRIKDEGREVAGRVMAAKQAPASELR